MKKSRLSIVFSGVGSQWSGMIEELESNKALRTIYKKWKNRLESRVGSKSINLSDINIFDFNNSMVNAVPTICLAQLTLWEFIKNKIDKDFIIIGHSIGEYAATYASGMIDDNGVIDLIIARTIVELKRNENKRMAVVDLSEDEYEKITLEFPSIEITGVNAKDQIVVGGSKGEIEELIYKYKGKYNIKSVSIKASCHGVDCAYLSSDFKKLINGVDVGSPDFDYISASEGLISKEDEVTFQFYVDSMKEKTDVYSAIKMAVELGGTNFTELSPHPLLLAPVQMISKEFNYPLYTSYLMSKGRGFEEVEIVKDVESKIDLDNVDLIKNKVSKNIIEIFGSELSARDYDKSFGDLGLTSFDILELSTSLNHDFKINIDPVDIYNYPSINELTNFICSIKNVVGESEYEYRQQDSSISIIGVGCNFPGGKSVDEFGEFLLSNQSSVKPVPLDRWDLSEINSDNGKINSNYISSISDVSMFDPGFFDISPIEAERMDPQQRILLETSWHALEDAGINAKELKGKDVGVFIGAMNTNDYVSRKGGFDNGSAWSTPYDSTGGANSALAGRLSYLMGLTGPAMTIDTACSSSLVALNQAITSIKAGECELAIVGGINLILAPWISMGYSKSGMLSPDGECKTFSDDANGYVRGEGCGVIVISKSKNHFRSYAEILGSSVNQNGRSSSLTAPSGNSQVSLIKKAMLKSGVKPEDVGYIEAHGTGTSLGDPIEVNSLQKVMNTNERKMKWVMGSVKSNIGHLEAAAGIAGIIKCLFILKENIIPAQVNFKSLNRNINLNNELTIIPLKNQKWPDGYNRKICGVSSFGFTGSNAHIILADPDKKNIVSREDLGGVNILPISTRSERSQKDLIKKHITVLKDKSLNINQYCRAIQNSRANFEYRNSIVGINKEELINQLELIRNNNSYEDTYDGNQKIAFVFSGQGVYYQGMGESLYRNFEVAKDIYDKCELISNKYGISIKTWKKTDKYFNNLNNTLAAQPAIFAIQASLVKILSSCGIHPDVVLGHSVGECAAWYVSGMLNLEDAFNLVCLRSTSMSQLPKGSMLDVNIKIDDIDKLKCADRFDIAAVNNPNRVVISGSIEDIEQCKKVFDDEDIAYINLDVSHAFHSRMMDPALESFNNLLKNTVFNKNKIKFISTVTGLKYEKNEFELTKEYCLRNVRDTVRFYEALQCLKDCELKTSVEISPKSSFLGLINKTIGHKSIGTLRGDFKESNNISCTLSELFESGIDVEFSKYDVDPMTYNYLPKYPFDRKPYWISSDYNHKEPRDSIKDVEFKILVPESSERILFDHRLLGRKVLPGALIYQVLSEKINKELKGIYEIKRLNFLRFVEVTNISDLNLSLKIESNKDIVLTGDGITHAVGVIGKLEKDKPLSSYRLDESIKNSNKYFGLFDHGISGLYLGNEMKNVRGISIDGDNVITKIATSDNGRFNLTKILDAVFQVSCSHAKGVSLISNYLPDSIEMGSYKSDLPNNLTAVGRLIEKNDDKASYGWELFDEYGSKIIHVDKVDVKKFNIELLSDFIFKKGISLSQPAWLNYTVMRPVNLGEMVAHFDGGGLRDSLIPIIEPFNNDLCIMDIPSILDVDGQIEVVKKIRDTLNRHKNTKLEKIYYVLIFKEIHDCNPLIGLFQSLLVECPDITGSIIFINKNFRENDIGSIKSIISNNESGIFKVLGDSVESYGLKASNNLESKVELDKDKFHIISGGNGKIGSNIAKWLSERLVKNIVILGRKNSLDLNYYESLSKNEKSIRYEKVDVSDSLALRNILDKYRGKIGGIYHCAGDLKDTSVFSIQDDDIEVVYNPKVKGLMNLHNETIDENLDVFFSCSSISAHFGAHGQVVYGASNAYCDGLIMYRNSIGLVGKSLAWPALLEGGMAERNNRGGIKYWESRGFNPIDDVTAKKYFFKSLSINNVISVVNNKEDKNTVVENNNILITDNENYLFDEFIKICNRIRPDFLSRYNKNPKLSFYDLGFDSFDLIELKTEVETKFDLSGNRFNKDTKIIDLKEILNINSKNINEIDIDDTVVSVVSAVLGRVNISDVLDIRLSDIGADSFDMIEIKNNIIDKGLKYISEAISTDSTVNEIIANLRLGDEVREKLDKEKEISSEIYKFDEIKGITSNFITEGWKEETYSCHSIKIDGRSVTSNFKSEEFVLPSDGIYHLPVFYSFLWAEILINEYVKYRFPGCGVLIEEIDVNLPERITTYSGMSASINLTSIGFLCKGDLKIKGDGEWNGKVIFKLIGANDLDFFNGSNRSVLISDHKSQSILESYRSRSIALDADIREFEISNEGISSCVKFFPGMQEMTLFNWLRVASQMAIIYSNNKLGLRNKPKNESYVIKANYKNDEKNGSDDVINNSFFPLREVLDNNVLYLTGKFVSSLGGSIHLKMNAPAKDYESSSVVEVVEGVI